MNIISKHTTGTTTTLTIELNEAELVHAKEHAINILGKDVKVPGFRGGKAPAAMLEKAISPALLQEEFLNDAINHAYGAVITEARLRPVAQPKIEVTKFVPFSQVEFTAEVVTIGEIKLGGYKDLKVKKQPAVVSADDIEKVINNMQRQLAEKQPVDRAAQDGDEVTIDFEGIDQKGEPVNGAKGEKYPLVLGSNTFIPGFEDHVIGLRPGDEKTFEIAFPKDYGVKALQSKKVTFAIKVHSVSEIKLGEVDDAFVKKVAPNLSTVAELKEDIKKQLHIEAESNAKKAYENALLAEIIAKSRVEIPDALIEQQAESVVRDLQQNLMYRGQTMDEYLEAMGLTAEEQRAKEILPEAERRVKGGIVLGEIADRENVSLTPEELEIRLSVLRQRYSGDAKMLEELNKPQNKEEIGGQIITEKTIAKIVSLNA